MKRIRKAFIASLMVSVMFGMTAMATPTVGDLREDKEEAEQELASLEARMTNLMKKINESEEKLVQTGQAIIQAEEDLSAAEKQEKEQYEAMKLRIVTMYENGNGVMLAKVLEADNLAELLQQAERVQAVHNYDRNQLEEYVQTKKQIVSLKDSLERDMSALEKQQKQYKKDKEDLDLMIARAEDKVDDLSDKIQAAAAAAARPNNSNSGSNSNQSSNNYVPPVGTGGGDAIVAAAYKYLGVPYRWGGASMNGVDCSGLVMLAHRAIGVRLSHYSGSIGSGGRSVSRANAQPGDVVCYSGHVGIYVGNGMMIHAPQTGDVVRVVKVYGSPWFRRYW